MANKVKSGKEILDEFFNSIEDIEGVDKAMAGKLKDLYDEDKFTDINIKNELQTLREENADKD